MYHLVRPDSQDRDYSFEDAFPRPPPLNFVFLSRYYFSQFDSKKTNGQAILTRLGVWKCYNHIIALCNYESILVKFSEIILLGIG